MVVRKRSRVLRSDLEKQIFDLKNLLEISKSLSSTLDYHILNDSILYTCLGALTVLKAAFFSKRNIDATDFTLHRSFLGFDIDHDRAYSIPESGALVEFLNRHPDCHDPETLYRTVPFCAEIEVLRSIDPKILVPLKAKGVVNGILVLGEKIGGEPFNERDRDYLRNIAGLAAIAIHNAYLFELTTTDMMTKLKLKHSFLHSLQERLRHGRTDETLSILMLDIDHFKRVNDTYGHQAGDETLKGTAAIVLEEVRLVDVAARYGGEEFIILLPGTPRAGAWEVAERIRKRIAASGFVCGQRIIRATVSLGVAMYDPQLDPSAEALIERVDRALYASKQNGRNRTSLAD